MPFSSKNEFKGWIKEYLRKVRQELKGQGTAQEEIKKWVHSSACGAVQHRACLTHTRTDIATARVRNATALV
jgi:hypothetical protein